MALLNNDLQAISQLLDKRFDEMDSKLSNMATKDDIQVLDHQISTLGDKVNALGNKVETIDNKVETLGDKVETIDNKVNALDDKVETLDNKIDTTKQELIERMDKLETDVLNTCLGYTDERYEIIMKKLNDIQSTVNTAARLKTIDNDVYNLVNQRIDEIEERVERLEYVS